MEIELTKLSTGELYFEIINNDDIYSTSEDISKVFNLDIDVYNSILVKEVIQHKHYTLCLNVSVDAYDDYDDLVFLSKETPMETYINRFKNTFIKELTLLALGNG